MKIGRWGLSIAGALTMLCAVLIAPHHDPGDSGRAIIQAATTAHLDRMEADLKASIALIDVLEPKETMPSGGAWSVAAIADDGLDLMRRVRDIEHGGRVKSAISLVVSPASRYSARV